ncbi:hypothetical protein M9Y10_000209 [Tritrichomonas musculus]|uniref:Transmembrane protein n=1 Tax=Tritrichomonas musculus TaxID=1915356 RepID=A0ABR2L6T1_9EUKA
MKRNSQNQEENPLDPKDDKYLKDINNRLESLEPNPHIAKSSIDDTTIETLSDDMTEVVPESKCTCDNFTILFTKLFYNFATILMYILSIAGLAGIYISCLISFFCFIIIVFIFFISFITAYVMSPIYLSLSGSWAKFVFSIIQVICSSPLVAFFLYFLTNAIRKLGDLMEQLPEFFAQRKVLIRNLKGEIQDINLFVSRVEHPILKIIWVCFLTLVRQLVITFIGLVFFFLTFVYDCPLLLGVLIFIPQLVQIVILLSPTYLDFFKLLFKGYTNKKGEIILSNDDRKNITNRFRHWIENKLIKKLKKIEDSDEGSILLNQETQTFENGQGEFSKKLGYSEQFYFDDQIKALDSIPNKEDKIEKSKNDFVKHVLYVFFATEYIPLYEYGRLIFMDQYRKNVKLVLFWVFFVLNLGLVIFDIYRIVETYQAIFLVSIFIRFFIIPLISFFHPLIQFFSIAKDKVLVVIINIASFVTFIIALIIVACISFNSMYQKVTRIQNLNYLPVNSSVAYLNEKMLGHQVCQFDLYGVTALDAYGYALGGYDVIDNPVVFENQMKYFFGENYSSHISYQVEKMSNEIPFIIYRDKNINTTIVAFRGFNSGTEIAFMVEMISNLYVIPFFQDLVPLIETLSDFSLGSQSTIAHRLGKLMLEPQNLFNSYIDKIIEICKENKIDEEERVLFTGINIGGTFAKIAGIQLKKYSLSFLTLPISGDFAIGTFDIEEEDMSYVTNVFVNNAVFGISESDVATNIGIFALEYKEPPKWCKSDICHFNMKKESVYPVVCEIAGLCGRNSQLDNYCKTIIGEKDVNTIKDFVMDL